MITRRSRRLHYLDSFVENSWELYIWLTFVIIASFIYTRVDNEVDAKKAFIALHIIIALGYFLLGCILFFIFSGIVEGLEQISKRAYFD